MQSLLCIFVYGYNPYIHFQWRLSIARELARQTFRRVCLSFARNIQTNIHPHGQCMLFLVNWSKPHKHRENTNSRQEGWAWPLQLVNNCTVLPNSVQTTCLKLNKMTQLTSCQANQKKAEKKEKQMYLLKQPFIVQTPILMKLGRCVKHKYATCMQ